MMEEMYTWALFRTQFRSIIDQLVGQGVRGPPAAHPSLLERGC